PTATGATIFEVAGLALTFDAHDGLSLSLRHHPRSIPSSIRSNTELLDGSSSDIATGGFRWYRRSLICRRNSSVDTFPRCAIFTANSANQLPWCRWPGDPNSTHRVASGSRGRPLTRSNPARPRNHLAVRT